MNNTDVLQTIVMNLLWAAGFVAVEYLCVLLAILADLWSGWRKAGVRKERRSSRGLRRTVDKIARYFNAMIALTVVDVMIIAGAAYLRSVQGWDVPIFPVCTLLGALALALLEVKSICEKASDKGDLQEAAALIHKLLANVSAAEIMAWLERRESAGSDKRL